MRTRLLLATAAATLALAAPAAAAPFTDVGPLSGPAGQVTFGGGTAAAPGQIDWDVVGGVPSPSLQGRLRMFDVPGATAQLQTEYYDANHVLLGIANGAPRNGIAGGLAVYPVNLTNGSSVGAVHVHEELLVNGVVVDAAICTIGQAAC
jgi:opacity protein-like surface antigen